MRRDILKFSYRFLLRRVALQICSIAFLPIASQALPPLVIEGTVLGKVKTSDESVVQVHRGVGAKEIDAPLNELGIELKNMERLEDIALDRQGDVWWLRPRPMSRQSWQGLVHTDLSRDQSLKTRVSGEWLEYPTVIEAGLAHDARDLVVLENKQNPFDPTLGREERIPRKEERAFAKIKVSGRSLEALTDADIKSGDIHAGALLSGRKQISQESLTVKWRRGAIEWLPYVQSRQNEFTSSISPLLSNTGRGLRTGTMVKWSDTSVPEEELSLSGAVSAESLTRIYADQSEARFQRYDFSTVLGKATSLSFIDLKVRLAADAAEDAVHTPRDSSFKAQIWDLGVEVSSPRRFQQGVVARVRRFALLPTPTQRFGDGALLMGSEDLQPETGLRASVGPWIQLAGMELEISGFYEQVVNAPVMIAVSPTSARTVGLGGVWAEGLDVRGSAGLGALKINVVYSYQDALNSSEISWQRGKAVPGRPRHAMKTGFEYFRGLWKGGADYGYRSEDALDLAGLWQKPPHHDLGAYLGYGTRDWEFRLAGGKLLAKENGLPSAEFAGQAAPDLLEPKLEQMEIRLQCEFLM